MSESLLDKVIKLSNIALELKRTVEDLEKERDSLQKQLQVAYIAINKAIGESVIGEGDCYEKIRNIYDILSIAREELYNITKERRIL